MKRHHLAVLAFAHLSLALLWSLPWFITQPVFAVSLGSGSKVFDGRSRFVYICAHVSDAVKVADAVWGPGGFVDMYVIYTMCVWVLPFAVHCSFPTACFHSRSSMGLELIDWICIKMKDNEMRQSTFTLGRSGQRIRGLFWLRSCKSGWYYHYKLTISRITLEINAWPWRQQVMRCYLWTEYINQSLSANSISQMSFASPKRPFSVLGVAFTVGLGVIPCIVYFKTLVGLLLLNTHWAVWVICLCIRYIIRRRCVLKLFSMPFKCSRS